MFNFRKIASALASTLMLGSTVGIAMAANYPAPFVQGGSADVALVYGSSAASSDLVAAIDITNNLQASLTSQGTGTGTGTTVTGEAYPLFTSSTKIYLNDSLNKARTTVSETNLPNALDEGTFQGDVTATITQKVEISGPLTGENRLVFGQHPTTDDDPVHAFDLGTTTGAHVFNMTLSFNKAVAFNHSDSEGERFNLFGTQVTVGAETDNTNIVLLKSATSVNLDSETNPSQEVTVSDKTYTIELVSASDTAATIRVTDSSGASDTKTIDEDKSKTINGLEVAVTNADETNFRLSATALVGADKIKLTDNAAVKLGSDETSLDGTNVRFGDNGAQKPGNITKITFQVYAEDSDADAILTGGEFLDPIFGSLKLSFPSLNIAATSTNREDIKISNSGSDKMTVNFQSWEASAPKTVEFYYNKTDSVRADGSTATGFAALADNNKFAINVFERSQINKSEFVVVGNQDTGGLWKLKTITNVSDSATQDNIVFENVMTGNTANAVMSSVEGSGTIDLGTQTFTVDYIDDRTKDGDENVRLRYQDGSRTTSNNAVVFPTIQTSKGARLFFYEPITINFTNWDSSGIGHVANLSVLKIPDGDGYTSVTITRPTLTTQTNYTVLVGSTTVDFPTNTTAAVELPIGRLNFTLRTTGAGMTPQNHTAKLYLSDVGGSLITNPAIVLFEEQDDSSSQNYEAVIVKIEGAGTTAASDGVSDVETTWGVDAAFDEIQVKSDTDLYRSADFWGTIITTDQSDTDSYVATISYPDEQVYAEIYLAEESAGFTGGTTGGVTTLGSVTVKDSEVSQVSGKNLVVLGGSCVNSVAASLLGSTTPLCGAGFSDKAKVASGEFLIKAFQSPYSSSKVALLVAGYNAADTTNAARYLTTQAVDTSVGKEYKGTSATSATLVTTTA